MKSLVYNNTNKIFRYLVYYILLKYNILMEKYSNIMNDFNNLDNNKFNSNNNSLDIQSIISAINDNYKQILLLLLAFIIIYVVDHITYYNTLFYGLTSSVPGASQQQPQQPQQIKSNTLKKKPRKLKK